MIGIAFEYCILDDELIEHSEMYKLLKWLWGEERARFYVEERIAVISEHPPPDEVKQHESTSMVG